MGVVGRGQLSYAPKPSRFRHLCPTRVPARTYSRRAGPQTHIGPDQLKRHRRVSQSQTADILINEETGKTIPSFVETLRKDFPTQFAIKRTIVFLFFIFFPFTFSYIIFLLFSLYFATHVKKTFASRTTQTFIFTEIFSGFCSESIKFDRVAFRVTGVPMQG